MPTNMMYADSMFPRLRENEDPAESIKRTNNYLYMLLEQLRYSFHNLELSNFNANALDRWEGIITDPIYVSLKGLDGKTAELTITAEKISSRLTDEVKGLGSVIEQTAEEIRAELYDEKNGKFTKLSATVDGLSLDIHGDGDKNLGLKATVDGLSIDINGENGKFSSLKNTVDGLSLDINGENGKFSSLKNTVDGLSLDINGDEGKFTKLSATVNGLGIQINGPDGTTGINATVSGLSAQVYGKDGEDTLYSRVQQSADKINFAVADKNSEGKFTLTSEMASLVAGNIDLKGYVTFSRLSDVEYDEDNNPKSIIDGGNIITGTLSASKITTGTLDASKVTVSNLDASKITTGTLHGKYLTAGTVTAAEIQGSTVYLLDSDGKTAAKFYLTSSDSSLSGVSNLDIESGAIAIYSTEGDVYIRSYDDLITNYAALQLKNGYTQTTGDLRPGQDNEDNLGSGSKRYDTLYSVNCEASASDRNKKKDISYGLHGYEEFFDALAPCTFRFIEGHERVHMGLIAQDVEECMTACGIDSMELAAFIKSPGEDGSGYDYCLRYGEFISLLIDQVQKLKKRVKALEEAA